MWLVASNESFVPVGRKQGKGIGVLWHKGIAGRLASEVASEYNFLYIAVFD